MNVKDHVVCDIENIVCFLLVRTLQNSAGNSAQVQGELLRKTLMAALHICEDREITTCVEDYCKPVNGEKDRYAPFVSLANTILSRFGKNVFFKNSVANLGFKPVDPENSFSFHTSDPTEIHTHHDDLSTKRKPHIIGTASQTANEALNRSITVRKNTLNNIQNKPEGYHEWHDVLIFIEFELLTKGAIEQPSSYNIELQKRIPANKIEVNGRFCGKSAHKEVKRRVYNDGKSYGFIPRAHAVRSMNNALSNEKKTTDIEENPTKKKAADEKIRKREKPAEIRAAMYATEMLRQRSYSMHAICLVMKDSAAWVWWYDHQGAIQSTGLDIIQDLPYFVALLWAFQHLDHEDWGTSPDLKPPEVLGSLSSTDGFHFIFQEDLNAPVHPENILHERYTILGRTTSAPEAMIKNDNRPLMLKMVWPRETRENQVDIIRESRLIKDANAISHTPIILSGSNHTYSTRKVTSEPTIADEGTKSTPRISRMPLGVLLVPTGTLEPDLFVTAWVDCYRCHYLFWEQGIKYGDISTANLLWDPEHQRGIFNDFDLVTTPNRARPRGTERTGTVPFMAMALVHEGDHERKVIREYHHDLESLIWVLLWMALLDNQSQKKFLRTWNPSDAILNKQTKMALLFAVYVYPEESAYAGDAKGEGRWTLAVSLLRYLESLLGRTMRDNSEKIPPKVLFMEFEEQVGMSWKSEKIPSGPML